MKNKVFILMLIYVFANMWGCKSSKSAQDLVSESKQMDDLIELISSKSIIFEAEAAYPMQSYAYTQVSSTLMQNTGNSVGRMDLMGNGDFIRIKGDSVQGRLAYFGEVRVVSSLNPQDSGIHFNGIPRSYEVSEDERKKLLKLKFDVKSKTELYDIVMNIYPNKRAYLLVNTMNRTPIRYEGRVNLLEEVKEAIE